MTHSASARTRRTKANGAGILAPLIREHSVFLGGSSMGKGFRRAARYYLRKAAPLKIPDAVLSPSVGDASNLLNPGVEHRVEEPFYVVDIGMVLSQLYQWKQYFPRGERRFVLASYIVLIFCKCCSSFWTATHHSIIAFALVNCDFFLSRSQTFMLCTFASCLLVEQLNHSMP